MGSLTLTELKQEVKAGLGNRSDLDSRLTRFLNLAQQRVARLHDFDEMEVISVSTLPFTGTFKDKYITFPLLRELYSFKVIEGQRSRRLWQITQRRWNRLIPAPQEYARRDLPIYYTLWSNSAVIWPLINRADVPIEAWHSVWPKDFSDGDPDMRSQFNQKDEVLIELSLVYAFNSLAKQEDAQKHWARAKPLLAEALNTDVEKPDLDIKPSLGDDHMVQLPGEYWNDPFTREVF